jgi:hypothetical protein
MGLGTPRIFFNTKDTKEHEEEERVSRFLG